MGAVASIPGSPPDLIRMPPGCTYVPRCPLAIAACSDREPDLVAVDTPHHDSRCIRWKTVAEQVGTAEVAVAEKIATA
jgi:oligopeptide/dipeptide ABC transporter ATP-binding protein